VPQLTVKYNHSYIQSHTSTRSLIMTGDSSSTTSISMKQTVRKSEKQITYKKSDLINIIQNTGNLIELVTFRL